MIKGICAWSIVSFFDIYSKYKIVITIQMKKGKKSLIGRYF